MALGQGCAFNVPASMAVSKSWLLLPFLGTKRGVYESNSAVVIKCFFLFLKLQWKKTPNHRTNTLTTEYRLTKPALSGTDRQRVSNSAGFNYCQCSGQSPWFTAAPPQEHSEHRPGKILHIQLSSLLQTLNLTLEIEPRMSGQQPVVLPRVW